MILTVVAIALIVVMAMAIARALLGPTIYDRILAVNLFGTKTVLLIAVVSYIFGCCVSRIFLPACMRRG